MADPTRDATYGHPEWPWWTILQAVQWMVAEEPFNGWLGDEDADARERRLAAAEELRVALANGRATAFGITAENRTPAPIETIEWATRKVYLSNWWMTEPYAAYILKKAEIQNLWPRDAAAAGKPSRRGRRKGVGSLASQDAPLISEMRRLIAAGDAASAYGAATLILDRAAGSGTDDSKRKRLVDRYHAEFPED